MSNQGSKESSLEKKSGHWKDCIKIYVKELTIMTVYFDLNALKSSAYFLITVGFLLTLVTMFVAMTDQVQFLEIHRSLPVATHNNNSEDLKSINEGSRRKDRVSSVCRTTPTTIKRELEPKDYRNFLVDDRHKVLYCYIPKAACTSWKNVMAMKTGLISLKRLKENPMIVHKEAYQSRLSEFSLPQIHKKLSTYTKFLITRNPFTRIYSAYKDKFLRQYKAYANKHYRHIFSSMKPALENINKQLLLPFDRFIELLVETKSSTSVPEDHQKRYFYYDEHWMETHKMCHPCVINYDIIAKTESMKQDQQQLLDLFNATALPRLNLNHNKSNIFDYKPPPLRDAYGMLRNETLKKFINIYQFDFELFEYSKSVPE